jgi:hypothetical protein
VYAYNLIIKFTEADAEIRGLVFKTRTENGTDIAGYGYGDFLTASFRRSQPQSGNLLK